MRFDSENMKVVICKKCKGLGFSEGMAGPYTCSECKGAGRVVEKTNKEEFPMGIFEWPKLNQQPLFPDFRDEPESEDDIDFVGDAPQFPQLGMPPVIVDVDLVDEDARSDNEDPGSDNEDTGSDNEDTGSDNEDLDTGEDGDDDED